MTHDGFNKILLSTEGDAECTYEREQCRWGNHQRAPEERSPSDVHDENQLQSIRSIRYTCIAFQQST